jgi:hypothetical protein
MHSQLTDATPFFHFLQSNKKIRGRSRELRQDTEPVPGCCVPGLHGCLSQSQRTINLNGLLKAYTQKGAALMPGGIYTNHDDPHDSVAYSCKSDDHDCLKQYFWNGNLQPTVTLKDARSRPVMQQSTAGSNSSKSYGRLFDMH